MIGPEASLQELKIPGGSQEIPLRGQKDRHPDYQCGGQLDGSRADKVAKNMDNDVFPL